uniref:IS1-like element transposase n=1 Tax=Escherichia coli TaxID=562 RepID=UPI001F3DE8F0|nr:IS1-like element transposase [Escherichia coli]
MAMNGVGCRATARIMGVGLNTILRHLKKLRPQSVTSRIQPGSDVIVCAEMDEQWAMSGLNRASAGCFTRMTGSGRRLLRTYSVNALWRRWGVL